MKVYTSKGTILVPDDAGARKTLKYIIEQEPGNSVAVIRGDGAQIVAHLDEPNGEVILESIESLDKEREEFMINIFRFCRSRALIADSSHYGI